MAADSNKVPGSPESGSPLPAPGGAPRILLVDDHAIVRQGLRQILADEFPAAVYGEAKDSREALDRLRAEKWDVMLLDINMPGAGGLDVLDQVKTIQPHVKVLVLTMHPEDQYAVRVLKAGAMGYLTKETASEQVVNAVTKVLSGGKYISESLAQCLVGTLNTPGAKPLHETLSDREYQILRMIAAGRVAKEIAAELSLSIKTVSTYRTRLLHKMNLKTNADVIRYAMRERLVD